MKAWIGISWDIEDLCFYVLTDCHHADFRKSREQVFLLSYSDSLERAERVVVRNILPPASPFFALLRQAPAGFGGLRRAS